MEDWFQMLFWLLHCFTDPRWNLFPELSIVNFLEISSPQSLFLHIFWKNMEAVENRN